MQPLHGSDPLALGPFRLLTRVGGGGMGEVYLGRDAFGAPAAVKVVRAEYSTDPEFRERFARETAVSARVRGPFVPLVLAAAPEAERPWMATAFVRGPSLGALVDRTGPLPESSAVLAARGIAHALAHVHAAGAVHRDLKPTNVLVSAHGPQVIDFGIARALEDAQLTRTGTMVGTPSFMSPEHGRGGPVTGASDVFALGGVLVHALTGTPPFGDGHPAHVLFRIARDRPRTGGVPPRLRALVEACLDKDPDQRPGADELLRALGGAPEPAEFAGPWAGPGAGALVAATEREVDDLLRASEPPTAPPDGPVPGAPGLGALEPAAQASARRSRRLPLLAAGAALAVLGAGGGLVALSAARDDGGSAAAASGEEVSAEPVGESCDTAATVAAGFDADPDSGAADDPGYTGLFTLSPDASVLAVDDARGVSLYDWRADEQRIGFVPNPDGEGHLYLPAFSPDGCSMAYPTSAGVRLYDLATGEFTRPAGNRPATATAFGPDGDRLVLGGEIADGGATVTVWDARTEELVQRFHGLSEVAGVGLSPDGDRVWGAGNGQIMVWNAESGERLASIREDDARWHSVHLFADSTEILFVSGGTPVLHDYADGEDLVEYPFDGQGEIVQVSVDPGAGRVYGALRVGEEPGGVRTWDLATGEEVAEEAESLVPHTTRAVEGIIAGHNRSRGVVEIRDAETMEVIGTID
ncbi:WD40 repeat domain-containing serine/threonine protein kinase [Nocardiopsis aegyptia]|uniref:WD40 repeat domain-containing serine/threonine protein kinase n=1 Tax=Nocardiopsis aegyptia TaxID=220378 RepID=UPI003670A57E